jgi:hypothetical protein
VRTTVSISERLLSEAKQVATTTGRTLSQVVEDALRESLARRQGTGRAPFQMRTFRGHGVLPGVDLDDSAALQDLMDGAVGVDRLR